MKFIVSYPKNLLILLCIWFCILSMNLFSYSLTISISSGKTDEKLAFNSLKEKKVFKTKHKLKARNNNKNYAKSENHVPEIDKFNPNPNSHNERESNSKKLSENYNAETPNMKYRTENENQNNYKNNKYKFKYLYGKSNTFEKNNFQNLNQNRNLTDNSNLTISVKKIPISQLFEKKMNDSSLIKNSMTFKNYLKNFQSNRLLGKQIEELFTIFKSKGAFLRDLDLKTASELFIKNFEKCDLNKSNKLSYIEFDKCMKTDPYLKSIRATPLKYAAFSNYSYTDEFGFNSYLFNILDKYEENQVTLYDYMILRLIAFAWKKCSVESPYIDELGFECALDIASDWRSISKNTARNLFKLGISLSPNGDKMRNMDFITFFLIANSARLFGKINGKENNDASISEFRNALDANILPFRYNLDIIDDIFKLVHSGEEQFNYGIDLESFFFFDYYLKIFYQGTLSSKRWFIDLAQFRAIISSNYLPSLFYKYFKTIPQNKLSRESFQSKEYQPVDPSLEDNYFMKFLELAKLNAKKRTNTNLINEALQNITLKYDEDAIIKKIYTILDSDEDDFVSFYDFGLFIQVFHLYSDIDTKNKGRLFAGELYQGLINSSGIPAISTYFKTKAKRLSLLDQDTYVDIFSFLVVIKMEDFIEKFKRISNPDLISEIELHGILKKLEYDGVPYSRYSQCSRGKTKDELKAFDWECVFTRIIKEALNFYEKSTDYITAKSYNMTLSTVQFEFPKALVE